MASKTFVLLSLCVVLSATSVISLDTANEPDAEDFRHPHPPICGDNQRYYKCLPCQTACGGLIVPCHGKCISGCGCIPGY
ncbi:hypothetical protein GDO86_012161 [Hymenochirus boettgeri]|uniref:Uncharacterized protein n=1 Tax=Hymenochirus boettgeri TaxID=247094 RepID=A0A8T2IRM3_9PIPI|nr:hypothetical protein GDO86_012161 [Hymenochirus boettgeri]